MRRCVLACVFLLCGAVLCFAPLAADIGGRVEYCSRYIWRGFDLNPHMKPVLQPSLEWEVGRTGLTLSLWSSISFNDKEFHECDATLSYNRAIGKNLSITAGLIHYGWYFTEDFRFKDDTSHEVFVSLELPSYFLQPSLTLFYDFSVGDGFYGQLEAAKDFSLFKGLDAALRASLGYNGGQWLAAGTDPGFSDLNFGLSLAWRAGSFRAAVSAHYTIVLLEAISPENHFWYGFSISFAGTRSRE